MWINRKQPARTAFYAVDKPVYKFKVDLKYKGLSFNFAVISFLLIQWPGRWLHPFQFPSLFFHERA